MAGNLLVGEVLFTLIVQLIKKPFLLLHRYNNKKGLNNTSLVEGESHSIYIITIELDWSFPKPFLDPLHILKDPDAHIPLYQKGDFLFTMNITK